VGHIQHRHFHSGAGQNVQPRACHNEKKTGSYDPAVTPQDKNERSRFDFLVQG